MNTEKIVNEETQPALKVVGVMRSTCSTCKHFGAQGVIGLVKESEGNDRYCSAHLFGDIDNEDFREMPFWEVTYGNSGNSKGVLKVHKDFGCLNHNETFD